MANAIEIISPNTDWELLRFKRVGSRWDKTMEISSADKEGDVDFEMIDDRETIQMYLSQEDIKALIKHLQKQLK